MDEKDYITRFEVDERLKRVDDEMIPYYPLGVYKDVTGGDK